MLDQTVKTVMIDDSMNVGELIAVVCEKIGLNNPEEYSFIAEVEREEREQFSMDEAPKEGERGAKKMAQLRKKLHTDDDINWLHHDKTLREQGVDESQVVVLQKKLFFSDQNIDRNDPVQLNLLYVQSRDAIVHGAHPCTIEEAIQFAALQCQVQYGDYDERKHRSGFLTLRELVPIDYVKTRNLEKQIVVEYRKLHGMTELNAKFRYIQLGRSLKTYGVTFFLVKEKLHGKNKLVPRLLGITRDAIMRVDERTKEIIRSWPLTTVRRWAASPNSFTLDFGDYADSYYSVQTGEGEAISQLIAGYIDIILKKRKEADRAIVYDNEEEAVVEDTVPSVRPTQLQRIKSPQSTAADGGAARPGKLQALMPGQQAAVGRTGTGVTPVGAKSVQAAARLHSSNAELRDVAALPPGSASGIGKAQAALIGHVNAGYAAVKAARNDLTRAQELPPLGNDPASMTWRRQTRVACEENGRTQAAALAAGVAQIVRLTADEPEHVDHVAVGSVITTMASNLAEFARSSRMLAALVPTTEQAKLLTVARKLADAANAVFAAVEPGSNKDRRDVMSAATALGAVVTDVVSSIGTSQLPKQAQAQLESAAKDISTAASSLVSQAKDVATKCQDPDQQNRVIQAAKAAALSTSQLISCTKVMSSIADNPLCQGQLVETARVVLGAVDGLVSSADQSCQDEAVKSTLRETAAVIKRSVERLQAQVTAIRRGADATALANASDHTGRRRSTIVHTVAPQTREEAVHTIVTSGDLLVQSMGNAPEMVRHAKLIAMAASSLVTVVKTDAAKERDTKERDRQLQAARTLADAAGTVVELAKGVAKSSTDAAQQMQLKAATESLRAATSAIAGDLVKSHVVHNLEQAARDTVALCTQLVSSSQASQESIRNTGAQSELAAAGKAIGDAMNPLVIAIREYNDEPSSPVARLNMLNASKALLIPGGRLVAAAKAAMPMLNDGAAAMALSSVQRATADSLVTLQEAHAQATAACGAIELDSAVSIVTGLDAELQSARKAATSGQLLALPGQTAESCLLDLGANSKTVSAAVAQLVTAAGQGNESYTGVAAKDMAEALRQLVVACRGVCATTKSSEQRDEILTAAQRTVVEAVELVTEVKTALKASTAEPERLQRMASVTKKVFTALNAVISCLPGQRDLDQSISAIASVTARLDQPPAPAALSPMSARQAQALVSTAAAELNTSAAKLVSATRGGPAEIAAAARAFEAHHAAFVESGSKMVSAAPDAQSRADVQNAVRVVSSNCGKLLLAAKSVSADPTAPMVKAQLAAGIRHVAESINAVLSAANVGASGQRECDAAIRSVSSVAAQLEQVDHSFNDASYFECLHDIATNGKELTNAMADLKQAVLHKDDHSALVRAVQAVAKAVSAIVESSAQAAFLTGVSDTSSRVAGDGVIDVSQITRASQAVGSACDLLQLTDISQQQILESATVIAKNTSALCTACKMASKKTTNPVAKHHFATSARAIANTTAELVAGMKRLAADMTPQSREACLRTTKPLVAAVDALVTFAASSDFATAPAMVSPEAMARQAPLTSAAKSIVAACVDTLERAKAVTSDPTTGADTLRDLDAGASKLIDAIRTLINSMRDLSPGQSDCDAATQELHRHVAEIDQTSLAATMGQLEPRSESSLDGLKQQLLMRLDALGESVAPFASAARCAPENVGHTVRAMAAHMPQITQAAIASASRITDRRDQTQLLDMVKTVFESAQELIRAGKESGGNAKATALHKAVDEAAQDMKSAINDLRHVLDTSPVGDRSVVDLIVTDIGRSMAAVTQPDVSASKVASEYQHQMLDECRTLGKVAARAVALGQTNPTELMRLARDLSSSYADMVSGVRGMAAVSTTEDAQRELVTAVADLGPACTQLVNSSYTVSVSSQDAAAKRQLVDDAKLVSEKAARVATALRSGMQGLETCQVAAQSVQALVGDLDTMAVFASTGALSATPNEHRSTFAEYKDVVQEVAQQLMDSTKQLVLGATASPDQLASAARTAQTSVHTLADSVKRTAQFISSEDQTAQELLLNSMRDVAAALADLLTASREACGRPTTDPVMNVLKESAKGMVGKISALLKVTKTIEDQAMRGVRAVEGAAEAISDQLRSMSSADPPRRADAKPEDVLATTQQVTQATAKFIAAAGSGRQADVVSGANMVRKAVVDLLETTKGVTMTATADFALQTSLQASARQTAQRSEELLRTVLASMTEARSAPGAAATAAASHAEASKRIAASVADVIRDVRKLKGSDLVDPDDPNVQAENELLAAASSIEAAARKLADLRPRETPRAANETLAFDEQIVEATKSIAAATSALIKAANAAQHELATSPPASPPTSPTQPRRKYHDDAMWSEGLASAAKAVASATAALCEAANNAMHGDASQETLISSARQVAAGTAQLVVACRVRGATGQAQTRLNQAAMAVKSATEQLVKSAEESSSFDESDDLVKVDQRFVGRIAQELSIQEEVLRKERELEEARKKLAALRVAKYNQPPSP